MTGKGISNVGTNVASGGGRGENSYASTNGRLPTISSNASPMMTGCRLNSTEWLVCYEKLSVTNLYIWHRRSWFLLSYNISPFFSSFFWLSLIMSMSNMTHICSWNIRSHTIMKWNLHPQMSFCCPRVHRLRAQVLLLPVISLVALGRDQDQGRGRVCLSECARSKDTGPTKKTNSR
jgi:hypothetical protein